MYRLILQSLIILASLYPVTELVVYPAPCRNVSGTCASPVSRTDLGPIHLTSRRLLISPVGRPPYRSRNGTNWDDSIYIGSPFRQIVLFSPPSRRSFVPGP